MLVELESCLCCGSAVIPVIDFGETPLANNYNVAGRFPLAVNRCSRCYHMQLSHSVDPAVLFGDYPYFSGTSSTFVQFTGSFVDFVNSRRPAARTVLDIACNDGTQLDAFKSRGFQTYGVDPAESVAVVAASKGHVVDIACLESTAFQQPFDVLVAQNVLAHTPRPVEFIRRCASLMTGRSRLFIMTSQANMVMNAEFDSVYHEHVSFFNARSIRWVLERAGLELRELTTWPIHGTSYVAVAAKPDVAFTDAAEERETLESEMGLYLPNTYSVWADQVRMKMKLAKHLVESYKASGHAVVGCGAAAKGISFLNVSGISLDRMVDTTPAKWGQRAAGCVIQPFDDLYSMTEEKLLFLILAWNFEREVRRNVIARRSNLRDSFLVLK